MEYKEARLRNLKLKLYKVSLSKGSNILEQHFNKESINKKLFFKKSDIEENINDIFDFKDGKYSIKREIVSEFNLYSTNYDHYSSRQQELEEELKNNYLEIKDIYMNFKPTEKAHEIIKKTKVTAAMLHWIHIPLYPEQTIMNLDIIPEENTEGYYNHFHPIEDLYRVIFENGEIAWDSIEGDYNLNSPMKMRIYSSRWGHDDIYSVKRTMTGWNFKHLSYDVNCSADGSLDGSKKDGFHSILAHDSIHYPYDGVKYALEILWKKADSTNMSIKELEGQIQEIGDWINAVEKATKKYQPNWVGYY